MSPKQDEVTTVKFVNKGYSFKTEGVRMVFDGFTKLYELEDEIKKTLPKFEKGQILQVEEITKEKHLTQGPSRYTEAKLVKTMEELGIGRPSTYASTISTLFDREYIKQEKGSIYATEQGIETSEKLNEFFAPFMETAYTAKMEQSLDDIVEGNDSKLGLLNDFYNQFEPLYKIALTDMKKTEPKKTGEKCPKCGNDLVFKKSKFGEFIACSSFPTCNYVKSKEEKPVEILENQVCPKCGKSLVKRKSKKGEFYACSGFPKCKFILGNEENENKPEEIYSDKKCPKCNKLLLIKQGRNGHGDFLACSGFPKCRYIESIKK